MSGKAEEDQVGLGPEGSPIASCLTPSEACCASHFLMSERQSCLLPHCLDAPPWSLHPLKDVAPLPCLATHLSCLKIDSLLGPQSPLAAGNGHSFLTSRSPGTFPAGHSMLPKPHPCFLAVDGSPGSPSSPHPLTAKGSRAHLLTLSLLHLHPHIS